MTSAIEQMNGRDYGEWVSLRYDPALIGVERHDCPEERVVRVDVVSSVRPAYGHMFALDLEVVRLALRPSPANYASHTVPLPVPVTPM